MYFKDLLTIHLLDKSLFFFLEAFTLKLPKPDDHEVTTSATLILPLSSQTTDSNRPKLCRPDTRKRVWNCF